MQNNNNSEYEDDLQFIDVENYRSQKFQPFSHDILVMEVLRKINEAGSHELRPGWFNEKISNKGNVIRVYIEDTRKKFIECVKTAIGVMRVDFDEEAETFIDGCLDTLETYRTNLLNAQWNWYSKLKPTQKNNWNGKIVKGFFNTDLGWYTKYVEIEVECYREIAQELNVLTGRKHMGAKEEEITEQL